MCGAEYPLKVAALGEGSSIYGFADESLRPPGADRQPAALADPAASAATPIRRTRSAIVVSAATFTATELSAQLVIRRPRCVSRLWRAVEGRFADRTRCRRTRGRRDRPAGRRRAHAAARSRARLIRSRRLSTRRDIRSRPIHSATVRLTRRDRMCRRARRSGLRPGPAPGNPVGAFGSVTLKPAATLACPIVSALDRWICGFRAAGGATVVRRARGRDQADLRLFLPRYERQSQRPHLRARLRQCARHRRLHARRRPPHHCEGRLARIAGRAGFFARRPGRGLPAFNTVLAPGSNHYHYDHIHVDLMRRARRRVICEPAAVSGEKIAARAPGRNPYARSAIPTSPARSAARRISTRARPRSQRETEFEDD